MFAERNGREDYGDRDTGERSEDEETKSMSLLIDLPRPRRILSMYIYVVAFSFLALVAIAWYFVNTFMQIFIETIVAANPSAFDSDVNTLIVNIWMWMPILFLFGLLIWVYVNAQKPKEYLAYE